MTSARALRIARIVLNAADAGRLAGFYVDVLGFEPVDAGDGVHALRLGATRLDMRQAGPGARPYPVDVPGWSPLFHHCAIVVSDFDAAMAALHRSSAWSAITQGGPQRLPANTGHVTAFKFRDPEGHPLELIALPGRAGSNAGRGPFERIDHSAISVADVARSIAFYVDLGLVENGRTLNSGSEQARLDGIEAPVVDVVALAAASGIKPHLELLGYRGLFDRRGTRAGPGDIAATRLVFGVADRAVLASMIGRYKDARGDASWSGASLRDPDGHLLELEVDEPGAPARDVNCGSS